MVMNNRKHVGAAGAYRFGYNGAEKDDETKGLDNSLDFGERIYDSRLGRFLSPDPVGDLNIAYSLYSFALCSPIALIDLKGLVADPASKAKKEHGPRINIGSDVKLKNNFESAKIHRYENSLAFGNGYKYVANIGISIWNTIVSSSEDVMNIVFDNANYSKYSSQKYLSSFINTLSWFAADQHKVSDVQKIISDPHFSEDVAAMIIMYKVGQLSFDKGKSQINISVGLGTDKPGANGKRILREFAAKIDAPMHEQWQQAGLLSNTSGAKSFIDIFKNVADKVVSSGGRINFNMNHFDMKAAIADYLGGFQSGYNLTNQEFITILMNKKYFKATDFFDGSGNLMNKEQLLNEVKALIKETK